MTGFVVQGHIQVHLNKLECREKKIIVTYFKKWNFPIF